MKLTELVRHHDKERLHLALPVGADLRRYELEVPALELGKALIASTKL